MAKLEEKALSILLFTTFQIDDFDWFLRADDDLYIRGEQLADLLRSLDSSKYVFLLFRSLCYLYNRRFIFRPHVLGQAGLGNSAEYGLLALGSTDNYCMGGPGVVLSKETLR